MDLGLLTLALVAGAVAAFNPCGFALLPAYLTVLVANPEEGGDGTTPAEASGSAVLRAVRFASGMTVGFVAVFGLFGLIVSPLALSIERYLPILTIVVGVALVALGVWLLLGHSMAIPGLAGRGSGPTRRWGSQVGYGVTFALASLSCTIAPFLAVTSTSLGASSFASALGAFIAYALGMGIVVLVLALAVATSSASLTTRLRRAGPLITRVSGGLLVLAGAYVAWYGWFEVRVLAGDTSRDPVVSAAIDVQATITRFVAGIPPIGLVAIGLAAVALGLLVAGRARIGRSVGGTRELVGCWRTSRRLQRYLDADVDARLTPEEVAEVAEHLEQCARCRDVAEDYRALSRVLAGVGVRHEPDPEAVARAQALVDRLEAPTS